PGTIVQHEHAHNGAVPTRPNVHVGRGAWARRASEDCVHCETTAARLCPPYTFHTSPNSRPVLWRNKELVYRPHIEGLVPGVHVSHHAVHAILHRRVRARHQLTAHGVVG